MKSMWLALITLSAGCAFAAEPQAPSGAIRGAGEWKKLFADERWYKDAKGNEQLFTGTLEGLPTDGGMTTLMRSAYYKLGARNVYTGAAKAPALDALVGKKIELRGKAVDMDGLEGQNVREIWPAAVREVGGGSTPLAGAPD